MDNKNIEAIYRNYIGQLNEGRVDDLSEFVNDRLTYNGRAMTRKEYEDERRRDKEQIPDLYFDVKILLVDKDQIACRIQFDCTPKSTFLGLEINGRKISFAENVFYKLNGMKIAEVWSVIDKVAIEAQLVRHE